MRTLRPAWWVTRSLHLSRDTHFWADFSLKLRPFRPSAVKNAGVLQGSHDVQQSREPARFFAQTSVSGRSQSGQSNIDHVRETRAGLAASASCSVTNTHQVSMRDKLQTRPAWNPGNAARDLRNARGRCVLITACARNQQPQNSDRTFVGIRSTRGVEHGALGFAANCCQHRAECCVDSCRRRGCGHVEEERLNCGS
jgi:hypothetical protein